MAPIAETESVDSHPEVDDVRDNYNCNTSNLELSSGSKCEENNTEIVTDIGSSKEMHSVSEMNDGKQTSMKENYENSLPDANGSSSNVNAVDDENSNSSDDVGENQTFSEMKALGLSAEMIDEERKLAKETESEFNKFSQTSVVLDNEEKKKRYNTLMTLLGKSNQYAMYMSEKLLQEKEKVEKSVDESPKVLQNSTNKRKNSSVRRKATKKVKTSQSERKYDPETHYINQRGFIVSKRQPKSLVGGIMRNYQLEGLEWLVALYKNAVNGILADEMGLGKTIQVISLLCHLREKNIFGPHLIIGPLSTLPNWMFEFANFAPDIPVVLFHGTLEKRMEIRNKFIEILKSKDRRELPVIVTSYEMPLRDKNFLSLVRWCYTIVDEGHRLKNYNSMLGTELRKYKTESRLLLTGTPLQNNITELWSLLNYLIPEIFDDLPMFQNLFDFSALYDSEKHDEFIEKEREEQIISKMHQILEPFLLRRLKSDVNLHLPRKKEILVYAPLMPEQEKLYKAVLDRSIGEIADNWSVISASDGITKTKRKCTLGRISYNDDWEIDEDLDYNTPIRQLQGPKMKKHLVENGVEYVLNVKLASPAMLLRKVVNHPFLVKTPIHPGTRDIIIDENMITQCGKLLVLDALLPKLKANGHKVLLFSTFTMLLDLIEEYVVMRNYKYVRLDGKSKIENRLESIKQFNSDSDIFIFLISTRAGGLGINLTAADTVIIYDSDWNPQVDLQAQDRCHRIGQTRPVLVYRLVTAGSIDQRIVDFATTKRRLEKLIVKKGKFKQEFNKDLISTDELRELLHSTDFKQVIHPNGLVLSDEQIEQLLDRSDLLNDDEKECMSPNKMKQIKSENVS